MVETLQPEDPNHQILEYGLAFWSPLWTNNGCETMRMGTILHFQDIIFMNQAPIEPILRHSVSIAPVMIINKHIFASHFHLIPFVSIWLIAVGRPQINNHINPHNSGIPTIVASNILVCLLGIKTI